MKKNNFTYGHRNKPLHIRFVRKKNEMIYYVNIYYNLFQCKNLKLFNHCQLNFISVNKYLLDTHIFYV